MSGLFLNSSFNWRPSPSALS